MAVPLSRFCLMAATRGSSRMAGSFSSPYRPEVWVKPMSVPLTRQIGAASRPDKSYLYCRIVCCFSARTLFTQSFDMERLELLGKPTIVAERMAVSAHGYSVAVSASSMGTIIYRTTGDVNRQTRQIIRFDRSGREIGKVGTVGGFSPAVSPAGRYVAVGRMDGKYNIWLLETARGVITPFTADPAGAQTPLWSPDGRYV